MVYSPIIPQTEAYVQRRSEQSTDRQNVSPHNKSVAEIVRCMVKCTNRPLPTKHQLNWIDFPNQSPTRIHNYCSGSDEPRGGNSGVLEIDSFLFFFIEEEGSLGFWASKESQIAVAIFKYPCCFRMSQKWSQFKSVKYLYYCTLSIFYLEFGTDFIETFLSVLWIVKIRCLFSTMFEYL